MFCSSSEGFCREGLLGAILFRAWLDILTAVGTNRWLCGEMRVCRDAPPEKFWHGQLGGSRDWGFRALNVGLWAGCFCLRHDVASHQAWLSAERRSG